MKNHKDTPGMKEAFSGPSQNDSLSYEECGEPIKVTLKGSQNAIVYVNGVAEDTLRNIENIRSGHKNDALTGDEGNNEIRGGEGDDTLVGGGGADRFVYTPDSFGDDVILDFDAAGGDRIDLAIKTTGGTGLSWNPDGPQAWSVWMEKGNDGVVLYADIDGNADTDFSITLRRGQ